MIEVSRVTVKVLQTIHDMAQVVFRHTYRDILSPEQMEYMMDMMYSLPNLQKQLDEGHHYYIAYIHENAAVYETIVEGSVSAAEDTTVCEAVVEESESAAEDAVGEYVPCGYVSVQHEGQDGDGTEIFHLHKIYVMPQFQGRGVGIRLFETAVRHVRTTLQTLTDHKTTKARMELNVNKYNTAVNFYKHLGMRILLEEDFPIGNGFYKTDYVMGLDI